jgi:hypothetical protein
MRSNAVNIARLIAFIGFVIRTTFGEVHLRKPAVVAVHAPAVQPVVVAAKATPANGAAPRNVAKLASVASKPAAHKVESRVDAELREVEQQVDKKKKQLQVQQGLEKEQQVEATKAQKRAIELRGKASKLEKEAQVATDIAKEKSEAAVQAEKRLNSTENKVQKLLEEENEMQRVLNQTQKEEIDLEHNLTALKLQKTRTTPPATSSLVAVKNAAASGATASTKAAPALSQEALQKLLEENNRLKHEKAELERQLSDRKVAKEKAKLKQKLKNRLALADRHMKLRKVRPRK